MTYPVGKAPDRPPGGRPDIIVNIIYQDQNYGYLGDAEVPRYNITESEVASASKNDKWRVTCRPYNMMYVVLMGLNLMGDDYLQVRRKTFRKTSQQFWGFFMKKKSVLVGLVKGQSKEEEEKESSFRLAYICARKYIILATS